MKVAFAILAIAAIAGLVTSFDRGIPEKPTQPWKDAFWLWEGEGPRLSPHKPALLYVQVQGSRLPVELPEADEYIVVKRLEPSDEFSAESAGKVARSYKDLLDSAAGTVRIIGLQIDYDSPTSRLNQYAKFLEEIHSELPSGSLLSITALLDWFKPGTAIASVISVDR
jgi:hypothetical protein